MLHSLSREWSSHGQNERDLTFKPIIQELLYRLPVKEDGSNAYQQRVLVPGCGVARLPIDICCEGYSVEGNEFSAYMLMASNYILNGVGVECDGGRGPVMSHLICPYVDKVCNVARVSDVLAPVKVPEVPACELLRQSTFHHLETESEYPRFSMSAGDFNSLYGPPPSSAAADVAVRAASAAASTPAPTPVNPNAFDAVVTCFFLDTAPVVMEYLQTLRHCLKPGGVWVNFGPLLYHWRADSEGNGDSRYDESIELSWEELRPVIEAMGFKFLVHRNYTDYASAGAGAGAGAGAAGIHQEQSGYIQDGTVKMVDVPYTKPHNSLMWTQYRALFFTCERL